jgi:excisionase family DNA binding protein
MTARPPRPPRSFEDAEHTNGSSLSLAVPLELVEAVAARVVDLLAERLPTQHGPQPWLDVDAAADYLACRSHRVYDLVAEGRVRCAKDGRRSLFRREWLDDYLLGEEGSA